MNKVSESTLSIPDYFSEGKRYNDYTGFIKKTFDKKFRKVSIDAGFTCPNRDGSKAMGGCTYCNNETFKPSYCSPTKTVSQQIEEGLEFFSKKYGDYDCHAYFQSYSNTYAGVAHLRSLYTQALSHPKVTGLIVGTRPDCLADDILDYLEEIASDYFVSLEIGVESTKEQSLQDINRGHTYVETVDAFERAKNRGFHLTAHIMMGLPGESREEILNHATELSKLPISSVKLHQLQIVKHTMMAKQYKDNPSMFNIFEVEDYVNLLVEFLERLDPKICIERFASESPADLLIAPKWGLKGFVIMGKVEKRLRELDTWQGKKFIPIQ